MVNLLLGASSMLVRRRAERELTAHRRGSARNGCLDGPISARPVIRCGESGSRAKARPAASGRGSPAPATAAGRPVARQATRGLAPAASRWESSCRDESRRSPGPAGLCRGCPRPPGAERCRQPAGAAAPHRIARRHRHLRCRACRGGELAADGGRRAGSRPASRPGRARARRRGLTGQPTVSRRRVWAPGAAAAGARCAVSAGDEPCSRRRPLPTPTAGRAASDDGPA